MDKKNIIKTFESSKPIIIWDEKKEIEADFIFPAELANSDIINFMVSQGKGLLCLAAEEIYLIQKGFFKLPSNNMDALNTNYFITIDHKKNVTGISSYERAKTIKSITENTTINDYKYPGHVQLLGSIGINKRKGHTESSVELMKLLGFKPFAALIEILDENGNSHNFNYIKSLSKKFKIPIISVEDIVIETVKNNLYVKPITEAKLPTKFGNFKIIGFENNFDKKEHFAIYKGNLNNNPLLVRIHSECVTGDVLNSKKCDCGSQLHLAMQKINNIGSGLIIYLRQEGRDIGITNKIKAYKLQDNGLDTVEANLKIGMPADNRDYAIAAQILKSLNIKNIILMTNNPDKVKQLKKYGINVKNMDTHIGEITPENKFYLKIKKLKMNHKIKIKEEI
ncbi:3,4-dihydroxy-2-butanone 4-phosphate synthase [Marinitoga sp. 1197]|uniref:bifunctional 3,4-dihydroxy-2-butanone-4-phosphate synthase/GTP cyclohydrolase II n=1 Tax=unclassified Marinitoga TaxID=2640159 RepID=UPI0006415831|nr:MULTISPECIES: bifunctional 3,4-dihydroxy-2-butanone-4-phosphate synthase/GTP cyclohydrolase II [unclassified Marinitoga]KLO22019.1 3,4-dihydroxy-2-butanone 4-phosphate synthase [Marinitoga sp. 1197]KLO24624.1 3,4-dihydroxy-2-butanone 4-phosphate synthase [Marinitoga sp. 1155]NUU98846.1 3,4-dihydroxy-2-butanone 4-phosphate synthase [Marinitoga sp. 1154]